VNNVEKTTSETEKAAVAGSGILGGVAGMVGSILDSVSDLVTSIIGEVRGGRDPGKVQEGK
jgi:hypothetical protein